MRLCMMPVSTFVGYFGITDFVNIKIYTNLIKLFHFGNFFKIFFHFKISILMCNDILECHVALSLRRESNIDPFLEIILKKI